MGSQHVCQGIMTMMMIMMNKNQNFNGGNKKLNYSTSILYFGVQIKLHVSRILSNQDLTYKIYYI